MFGTTRPPARVHRRRWAVARQPAPPAPPCSCPPLRSAPRLSVRQSASAPPRSVVQSSVASPRHATADVSSGSSGLVRAVVTSSSLRLYPPPPAGTPLFLVKTGGGCQRGFRVSRRRHVVPPNSARAGMPRLQQIVQFQSVCCRTKSSGLPYRSSLEVCARRWTVTVLPRDQRQSDSASRQE